MLIIWCTQWVWHFHLPGFPLPPFHPPDSHLPDTRCTCRQPAPANSPAACTSPVRNQPAHAGPTSPGCQLAQAHSTSLQLATTSSDNNTLLLAKRDYSHVKSHMLMKWTLKVDLPSSPIAKSVVRISEHNVKAHSDFDSALTFNNLAPTGQMWSSRGRHSHKDFRSSHTSWWSKDW